MQVMSAQVRRRFVLICYWAGLHSLFSCLHAGSECKLRLEYRMSIGGQLRIVTRPPVVVWLGGNTITMAGQYGSQDTGDYLQYASYPRRYKLYL